jgi:hypothetical protein
LTFKKKKKDQVNRRIRSNRIRSMNYRKRKREHYENLESKVKELECEVSTLKHKIEKYQQIIDSLNILEERKGEINQFVENETFSVCGIPNLIQKNPVLVNSTMLDQTLELVGPYGSERINAIQKSFKIIIDNSLPLHMKIILRCMNDKSNEEMIDIARESLNRAKTESKYLIKEEKLTVENLISLPKYTQRFIDSWKYHLPLIRKVLFDIKYNMKDLYNLKIQLLSNLKFLQDHLSDSFSTFTKYDYAEISKMAHRAQEENLLDLKSLWGIDESSIADEIPKTD